MQFKQRALAALIALVLCLLGGATHSPLFAVSCIAETAAPELEIHVAAVPDEFISPGEAQLSFELTNRSEALLESVCLTSADGQLSEPIGEIAPGASLTWNRIHALTGAELDSGAIEYVVTCTAGGEIFSYPATAAIVKASAEPSVEFLREVSSRSATDGNSITIVYKIRNTGNVPVAAVSVTDPLGAFDVRLETLEAGASKVFIQHVQPDETTVSQPVLTYSAENSADVYTTALDALSLRPAQGMLDAVITAGRSMFSSDTAEVVLQLVNSGNLDYTDITVYDDVYGGVIEDSISVPAGGEPVEVARSYPIREDSDYRWRITGKTSAGDQIDYITNTASVYLDPADTDALLTVKATTAMPKISRSGYVPIRIELTNIGSATAARVQLREETIGEICELAVVPTGDPTVYELRHEIMQNASLVFSAVYTDRYGQERIATSQPLEITIGRGGQTPETDGRSNQLFGGIATQMHNTPLFIAMLIGSCLVLIALIAALVITSRRARVRRKSRAAAIRQRRKEDMAKTAPFTPIRKKSTAKK